MYIYIVENKLFHSYNNYKIVYSIMRARVYVHWFYIWNLIGLQLVVTVVNISSFF